MFLKPQEVTIMIQQDLMVIKEIDKKIKESEYLLTVLDLMLTREIIVRHMLEKMGKRAS